MRVLYETAFYLLSYYQYPLDAVARIEPKYHILIFTSLKKHTVLSHSLKANVIV